MPWHMGHGKAGTKGVPPYSDLQAPPPTPPTPPCACAACA